MVRPLDIVVGFQPGPGHAARMGAIAAALHGRGHRVVLATAPGYRKRLNGVAHSDFIPIGPEWMEDHVQIQSSGDVWQDTRDRSHSIVTKFFGAAGHVAEDLRNAFQARGRPDCFVFDYMLHGGPLAAHALGVPWAAAFALTVPFRIAGWPPFGSHLSYAASPEESRTYAAMHRIVDRENHHVYSPVLQLWAQSGHGFRNVWEPFQKLAAVKMIGSLPHCDFPLPASSRSGLQYVGPLVDLNAPEGDGHILADRWPLERFLQARRGALIHVTLGMTFSRASPALNTVLQGLDDPNWSIVVATGHLQLDEAPSGHFHIAPYLPHRRLFPELDVLVCHGGANTLMKALHFGVPVLVIPLGAEQRGNAARFEHAGIARVLLPQELDTLHVHRAVASLLDISNGYAARARALAQRAQAANASQCAADLIERMCRTCHG